MQRLWQAGNPMPAFMFEQVMGALQIALRQILQLFVGSEAHAHVIVRMSFWLSTASGGRQALKMPAWYWSRSTVGRFA